MFSYFLKYPDKILEPFLQHFLLTSQALIYSIILASILTMLILPYKSVSKIIVGIFSGIYCIPSLALFALFIPFSGLGKKTAIFVLILYNQFYLMRSFLSGLHSVDSSFIEIATGMGLSRWQILYKVQIPLAMPIILAGIRITSIATISIAVIAASVQAGGLGNLLLEGMRTRNTIKIIWGVILAGVLNLLFHSLFFQLEKYSKRKIHQL